MSYNLINTTISKKDTISDKDTGVNNTFHLFNEQGGSNIQDISGKNSGKADRYTREEIMSDVAQFNKYYKNFENDFNVTNAYNSVEGRAELVGEKHFEGANGRVSGVGKTAIPSFNMDQGGEHEIYNNFSSDSIKGNFEQTDFSKYYFSEHNVEGIQRSIKKEVFDLSNGQFKIDHQSENVIKTVMRSYFLQYKLKLNVDILSQIREVNKKTIKWCTDEIYSNLLQYQQYKHDISNMPQQMNRPLNMSIKGSRTFDLSDRNNM